MKLANNPLKQALLLAKFFNFKIFPCNNNGEPLVSSTFKASSKKEQIYEWWEQYHEPAFGLRTGEYLVLKITNSKGGFKYFDYIQLLYGEDWQVTPTAVNEVGDKHFFFKNSSHIESFNLFPGISVQCLGGQVFLPPSIIKKNKYRWIISPFKVEFGTTPAWLQNHLMKIGSQLENRRGLYE